MQLYIETKLSHVCPLYMGREVPHTALYSHASHEHYVPTWPQVDMCREALTDLLHINSSLAGMHGNCG